eukprot:4241960-Amphidinium_carterae.2
MAPLFCYVATTQGILLLTTSAKGGDVEERRCAIGASMRCGLCQIWVRVGPTRHLLMRSVLSSLPTLQIDGAA